MMSGFYLGADNTHGFARFTSAHKNRSKMYNFQKSEFSVLLLVLVRTRTVTYYQNSEHSVSFSEHSCTRGKKYLPD